MNLAFWLLIIVLLVGVWFGLSFLFSPVGNKLYDVYDKTEKIINNVEEDTKDEEGK